MVKCFFFAWALWFSHKTLVLDVYISTLALHMWRMHLICCCKFEVQQILVGLFSVIPNHVTIVMISVLRVYDLLTVATMVIQEPKNSNNNQNQLFFSFNFFWTEFILEVRVLGGKLITNRTAVKQQIGKRAQINETCRHGSIDPKPITMKMPTLNEQLAIVIINPRSDGSLHTNTHRKSNQFLVKFMYLKNWLT